MHIVAEHCSTCHLAFACKQALVALACYLFRQRSMHIDLCAWCIVQDAVVRADCVACVPATTAKLAEGKHQCEMHKLVRSSWVSVHASPAAAAVAAPAPEIMVRRAFGHHVVWQPKERTQQRTTHALSACFKSYSIRCCIRK
jgi:hypothetical protein